MKKVLAIFMAIAMVATMFSLSVVSFAEGETEKTSISKYLGTASEKNFGLVFDRKLKEVIVDESQGSLSKPWNLHVFNPETAINDNKISQTHPTVGTMIIDQINDSAAAGESVKIVLTASAEEAIIFCGLKGTAEAPIVIVSADGPTKMSFKNELSTAPAITLVDCEYVTVKNITVSALNNGIVIDGCANVTVEGVDFSQVGYVDYLTPVVDDAGNESINAMETAALVEKGSSVLVGGDCTDITVSACTFTKCRAGVVVDSTVIEEETEEDADAPAEASEEVAADVKGIEVTDCQFDGMNIAAVVADGGEDITVSGGSVTKSGDVINADGYDGTAAAAFVLDGAKNVTIEKIYSTDNAAFIDASDATGRVRYNVSERDGGSFVAAPELLVYNNTFTTAKAINLEATVRNNIFAMLIGEKAIVSDGDNNCYYWTSKGDRGSIRKNPRFANAYDGSIEGTSVRDNYILATGSPCIGAGEKVEDDMGEADFYGNAIGESYNIGAYAGAGADATTEIVSDFVDFFNYIFAVIKNFLGIK
ncbi:MAG: hypothetical protein IJF20_05470 [Clostridia bacterium]|nr:hypothetical protein [Clostridia bacterium]